MKQKIKKVFENAVWWSGVAMVGLILGISIQFVKAWTEPTVAPPGGNVGAPVNTSPLDQVKAGGLGVLSLLTHGFQLYNNPDLNGDGLVDNDVTGKVLTAIDANGTAAWAAGGGTGSYGACYVSYGQPDGSADSSGKCLAEFTNEGLLGTYGRASFNTALAFNPPGAGAGTDIIPSNGVYNWTTDACNPKAYLCCRN
jgi:hypothetical protein